MKILWMIRCLIYYLADYDSVMAYLDAHPAVKQKSVMSGEYADFFPSRWRYTWKMLGIEWKHRDRYGRKCRRAGGNCARCNAKHC